MSKFNINFYAYKVGEGSALAGYAHGRVSNKGVELTNTPNGKAVARVMLSMKDCSYQIKSALKAVGLPETAITPMVNNNIEYWPIRVSVWEKQGENMAKAIKPGDYIRLVGPVTVGEFTGTDGVKHYNLNMSAYAWEKDWGSNPKSTSQATPTVSATPVTEAPTMDTAEISSEVEMPSLEDFSSPLSDADMPW